MNKIDFIKKHRFNCKKNCMKTPLFLHIELTQYCPLGCKQCYMLQNEGNEIDWDICTNIIQQAKDLGVSQLLLTGGEPLLYSKLVPCIELIRKLGMNSSLSSSGFGLNDDFCKEIIDAGISKVYISLNGSTEKIHNKSRNSFAIAVNAIKTFKKHNIFCGINWVARKDNFKDFKELYSLSTSIKVDQIVVLANKKTKDGNIYSNMAYEELGELSNVIKELDKNGNYIAIDPCFTSLSKFLQQRQPFSSFSQCNAGKTFFDILSSGTFTPCRHLHGLDECSFKDTSLEKFWNSSKDVFISRQIKKHICQEVV